MTREETWVGYDQYQEPELGTGRGEVDEDPDQPAAVLWLPYPDAFGWREHTVKRKSTPAPKRKGWGF